MLKIKNFVAPMLRTTGPLTALCLMAALLCAQPALALSRLWETTTLGAVGDPDVTSAAAASMADGGVVVAGRLRSGPAGSGPLETGILIVRFSAAGDVQWTSRLGSSADIAVIRLAVDANQDIVVGGFSATAFPGMRFALLAKYRGSTGTRTWSKSIDTALLNESLVRLLVDSDGNVVMASNRSHTDNSSAGWRLRKLAALDGASVWDHVWSAESGHTRLRDAAQFSDGDIALAGSMNVDLGDGLRPRMATIRVSSADGVVRWSSFPPASSLLSTGFLVRVDDNDDVVVAGTAGTGHPALMKLAGQTGQSLWSVAVSELPGGSGTSGFHLALANNGDPLLARELSNRSWLTARRSTSDGELLWQQAVPNPQEIPTTVKSMTSSADGAVFVEGSDYSPGTGNRAVLYAFAGDSGTLRWSAQTPRVGEASNFAGVAASGDSAVVLFGFDQSTAGGNNILVSKYATATGALLWQRHELDQQMPETLRCGNNSELYGRPAIPANDGSVIVVGCHFVDQVTQHLLIEKVSAAGTRLWSRLYQGQDGRSARAGDLAVDTAGNVHVAMRRQVSDGWQQVWLELSGASGIELRQTVLAASVSSQDSAALCLVHKQPDALYVSWAERVQGQYETVHARFDLTSSHQVWQTRVVAPPGGARGAYVMGVDANGNAVLGGSVIPAGASSSFPELMVLSQDTGQVLWGDIDDSMTGGVNGVAVDTEGRLIVSSGGIVSAGLRFSKYRGNGELVWRTLPLTPSNLRPNATAMTLDSNGDVLFAGLNLEGPLLSTGKFMVGRVRGSDGQWLWTHRNDVPTALYTEATSLVIEPSGRVRVAGFDSDGTVSPQTLIVDYDGQTGQRLAAYPMGGGRMVRLLRTDDGGLRLVDDVTVDGGRRIRIAALVTPDSIFGDGFEND